MKRKNKASGRQCEIKEETVRVTFNITVEQQEWILAEAGKLGITSSKFMRLILEGLQDEDVYRMFKTSHKIFVVGIA